MTLFSILQKFLLLPNIHSKNNPYIVVQYKNRTRINAVMTLEYLLVLVAVLQIRHMSGFEERNMLGLKRGALFCHCHLR